MMQEEQAPAVHAEEQQQDEEMEVSVVVHVERVLDFTCSLICWFHCYRSLNIAH